MIYVTIQGHKYEADGPAELVSQLRESSFIATANDVEFMKLSAQRIAVHSGAVVRHDAAENYVADLIQHGLMKVGKAEPK